MNPVNPKDILGSVKLPLNAFPAAAVALGCLGCFEGGLKYGRHNVRAMPIQLSEYLNATKRHLDALWEGEDIDPESGIPHLGKALSSLAVVAEAYFAGTLIDDRPVDGSYGHRVAELVPIVRKLREKQAGSPKPWDYIRSADPERIVPVPVEEPAFPAKNTFFVTP